MIAPRAAIFLVAGQGSRMGALTAHYPKCLLPVGQLAVLDTLLPQALKTGEREIVLVTGYQAEAVQAWLNRFYPDAGITLVHNADYAQDVNILSVEKGVNALRFPERGYSIIETDILIDPRAWPQIHHAESSSTSFWLTHGRYSAGLTGGIVEVVDDALTIDRISYQPLYDEAFEGWFKMVGMLSVAPDEVAADRRLRRQALKQGCNQYYMAPWMAHRQALPCVALDISRRFARAFNTPADYQHAVDDYKKLLSCTEELAHANRVC